MQDNLENINNLIATMTEISKRISKMISQLLWRAILVTSTGRIYFEFIKVHLRCWHCIDSFEKLVFANASFNLFKFFE